VFPAATQSAASARNIAARAFAALAALVALTAVMLLAASVAPTAAHATTVPVLPQTSKIAVGSQFHGTWADLSDADRARNLDMLVASGTTWVRIDVAWSTIQPTARGSYDMAWGVPFVEKVLNMAHSRGLHVLGTGPTRRPAVGSCRRT
jgi:hypothetical protein